MPYQSDTAVVYVIQMPRPRKSDGWVPSFEAAAAHGRLEFVFDMEDQIFREPKAMMLKARKRLANFRPSMDFLVWSHFADPAAAWLVTFLLAQTATELRYLYWSKNRHEPNAPGYYYPVTISL
jgi:hypothetical protein